MRAISLEERKGAVVETRDSPRRRCRNNAYTFFRSRRGRADCARPWVRSAPGHGFRGRRRFAALARGFRRVQRRLIETKPGFFRLPSLPFRLLKGVRGLELSLGQKARNVTADAVEEP